MWIERLEFIGFGNLTGQRIEFGRNKLSVVVQPNEYGKSTMADAIWSMLFDFAEGEGDEKKPLSGAAFKAVLDLESKERHMRLIRNFAERKLKVLDLSKDLGKASADITAEFGDAVHTEEFGRSLTGLNRRLFKSCCVLGQRQLDHRPFAGDRVLSSLLLNLADSGGNSFNVLDAIAKLEDRLENFDFRAKRYQSKELVEQLEAQRDQLADNLQRLESERDDCDREVQRLLQIEDRLHLLNRKLAADEYFQLFLELADLDSRLSRAQEKLLRVKELQNIVQAYASYQHLPIQKQKDIEELWIGRQARLSDMRRLETEQKAKSMEAQLKDLEMRERSEGLHEFTVEEAQMLTSLARTLREATNHLEELRLRRIAELERLTKSNIDLTEIASVRSSLLTLEPKDLHDARALSDWQENTEDRATEARHALQRSTAAVEEIQKERLRWVRSVQSVFWPSLVLAAASLGLSLYMACYQHLSIATMPVACAVAAYVLLFTAALGCFLAAERVRATFRVAEEAMARNEEFRQTAALQDVQSKLANIRTKLQSIARKAGLADAEDLLSRIRVYAGCAAQLTELDSIDHSILTRTHHIAQLKVQLADFFRRANRVVADVTPKEASRLADTVNWVIETRKRGELGGSEFGDHRESELRFLADEIKHSESHLADHFQRAGLQFQDVNDGYYQWTEAVVAYRRWETNCVELQRLEEDKTTDLIPSELASIMQRLESRKNDLWTRIQELMMQNPEIAGMPPPVGEEMQLSYRQELSEVKNEVEELRREKEELTVQLRAGMKNYQDNYLKYLEELEAIERDLKHVKHHRTSLRMARDTFLRLAEENHRVWADKLNDISRDMLKALGTEYEAVEFDAELQISVRRKGHRELISPWQIQEQLSTGTREQLHWLARMAVVRFLSSNRPLPMVLDEPFSEFDDERFLKIMRFLVNNIARHNQVIIFSCHQQRHEWLMDQLDPRERESVELCRLQSMTMAPR